MFYLPYFCLFGYMVIIYFQGRFYVSTSWARKWAIKSKIWRYWWTKFLYCYRFNLPYCITMSNLIKLSKRVHLLLQYLIFIWSVCQHFIYLTLWFHLQHYRSYVSVRFTFQSSKVNGLRSEWRYYICYWYGFFPLSTIFRLDFRTVPTVWYFFFFFILLNYRILPTADVFFELSGKRSLICNISTKNDKSIVTPNVIRSPSTTGM
jgi:hypothetical protein